MSAKNSVRSKPATPEELIGRLRDGSADLLPACNPHASPSWTGVDGRSGFAELCDGRRVFAKLSDPDCELYAACGNRAAAAELAGSLRIGPGVLATDADTAIVTEALDGSWRVATLGDMRDLQFNLAVLSARKRLHQGPPLPVTRTVFDHIEVLISTLRDRAAYEPPELGWLAENVGEVGRAIAAAGYDSRPAHCDGTVSNVLVNEAGDVRVVDYDLACNTDPYEDFGSYFAEAYQFERDARACFDAFFGGIDEALFSRVLLYGAADDLRWGLIGLVRNAYVSRTSVEFLKYAQWRLLRCRMAVRDRRFEERIRLL